MGIVLTMTILLGFGVFLRLYPSAGYHHVGFDEHGYMVFVTQIQKAGVWNYDAVVQVYVERQYKLQEAVVPAMRLAFLVPAALCADAFGLRAFSALHVVAATAGVLLLFLCALFAYRMGGTVPMIGMTALFATAPLQIYFCQRAMIDGYFAFWTVAALWLAWENLQYPKHLGWLISYTLCLTILVLTKENAAFVVFAIFALLLLNRSLRIGTVTPQLLAATVIGPALAVLLLVGSGRRFFRVDPFLLDVCSEVPRELLFDRGAGRSLVSLCGGFCDSLPGPRGICLRPNLPTQKIRSPGCLHGRVPRSLP